MLATMNHHLYVIRGFLFSLEKIHYLLMLPASILNLLLELGLPDLMLVKIPVLKRNKHPCY
jgi:hypothetical protein